MVTTQVHKSIPVELELEALRFMELSMTSKSYVDPKDIQALAVLLHELVVAKHSLELQTAALISTSDSVLQSLLSMSRFMDTTNRRLEYLEAGLVELRQAMVDNTASVSSTLNHIAGQVAAQMEKPKRAPRKQKTGTEVLAEAIEAGEYPLPETH